MNAWHRKTAATYAYDEWGNGTSWRTLSSLSYNTAGLVSRQDYGNGDYLINTYDNLDRLTEKRYNGSNDSVKIAYNTQGQTFAVKDTANSRYTKFTYDLAGRVVRSATYPTATMNGAFVTDMRYGYESKTNRLAEFSYRMPNQGSTTGEYRTANFNLIYGTGANIDRVTALQMQGENRIQFAYDGFGRVTSRTYSATGGESPRVTTYTYHDVGEDRTTSLVKTVNNSGLGEIGYTYDAVGNITQITKDGAVQESYTYDTLNQLKTVTRGGVTTEYSYQNGNITSVTQNGETVKTYGYTDSTWSDLLTSFNGQTITYDEIGNPLQYRDGMSFTWDKGRQLQSVTKNGVTTSYTYDENGLRLSKTTGGVTTKIYRTNGQMVGMNSSDGKDLMFLLDGSGNVYGLHYDHYSSEAQTAAATYYFAYNAQGDVIGIYDASGTVVATYAYDEWGNCTVQVLAADSNGHAADSPDHIAQVNPFRYRGYFYDGETGFYYLNSRYYDPETGRFLNADGYVSTGQSILGNNMFAYCLNNPVNNHNPSGKFALTATFCGIALWEIGVALVGLIGALVLADTVARNPPSFPSISLPKIESKSESDSNTKDIAPAIPKDPPKKETVIYRYGGTNPGNFVPSPRDVATNSGLSFSTVPPPPGFKAAVTTIEALNATGVVRAYQDRPGHVRVDPVVGTLADWRAGGSEHPCTIAVKSVVVKWDGES